MKFINKVLFTFKESFSGLFKNFHKSIIQFAVCFVSLTFFSVIYGVNLNVQNVSSNMRSEIEISIFLKDDISDNDFSAIESKIKNNDNVDSFTFTSREEARREGERLLKDYPEMLSSLNNFEDHPFPASFTVTLKDVNETESFANLFKGLSGVEDDGVTYGKDYMEKIINLSNGLHYGSIIALGFFFVIAIFFMMSIINVIISAKNKQCSIMFLIGASPVQIRMPFYIQGVTIGFMSSALSYFTFKTAYDWVTSNLSIPLVDITNDSSMLFLFISSVGILTGLVATKIALKKFNKITKNTAKVSNKR